MVVKRLSAKTVIRYLLFRILYTKHNQNTRMIGRGIKNNLTWAPFSQHVSGVGVNGIMIISLE